MGDPQQEVSATKRSRLIILGRVLLVAAVAVLVVNWTWGRLPDEPAMTGRVMTIGETKIRYVEQAGRGTPVLLIHGQPGTADDFEEVMPRLKGRRVIAIDRPGYGFSSGRFVRFVDQVSIANTLLDRLGIRRVVLVGHSYGATISLRYAQRYPRRVRGLVLVAPGAGGFRPGTARLAEGRLIQLLGVPGIRQVAHATFSQAVRTATARMGDSEAFAPNPVDDRHRKRLLGLTMKPGDFDALGDERIESRDVLPRIDSTLSSTSVPAVVIAGDGDRLIPVRYGRALARELPMARLQVVKSGHMVLYAAPDVVAAAVRSFP